VASRGRDPSHVCATVGKVNEMEWRGLWKDTRPATRLLMYGYLTSPPNSASKSGVDIPINVVLGVAQASCCTLCLYGREACKTVGRYLWCLCIVAVAMEHSPLFCPSCECPAPSAIVMVDLPLFSSWASIGSEDCHWNQYLRNCPILNWWKMVVYGQILHVVFGGPSHFFLALLMLSDTIR
jgi:hypothetical protein